MGHASSVLVVHSPDPDIDAALLEEILPFRRQKQKGPAEQSSIIILLWEQDSLSLMLIPSPQATASAWVVANSTAWTRIQKAAQTYVPTRLHSIASLSGPGGMQIWLPSGSSIVVITSESIASDEDREKIAKCLGSGAAAVMTNGRTRRDNDHNDEKSAADETSNETSERASRRDSSNSSSSSPAKQRQPKRPDAPDLNSLAVKIMQKQGTWDANFALNTREPVEFETDLFKGRILMLVRPPNLDDDPYWSEKIFEKKKRRFVINLQGKFKRELKGDLYVGGETTAPMNLSLFTRGILSMIIKLLENSFAGLRYSFGDEKKNLAPRIVVPAHAAFEKVVVTPPGTDPPPVSGEPFEESKADRANRLKSKDWTWNTTDTYSFSFYSMYLAMSEWKVVNLSVYPDINLRRLWNDGDFRIVMYEKTGPEKEHPSSAIEYALNVNLRYLGDRRVSDEEASNSPEQEFDDIALDSDTRHPYNQDDTESGMERLSRSESSVFPAIMESDSSSEDTDFYDAEDKSEAFDIPNDFSQRAYEAIDLLAKIDELVPVWIHISAGKGHYVRVFALNWGSATLLFSATDCEDYLGSSELADSIHEQIEEHFSPRLSTHERSRRCMGLFLKAMGAKAVEEIKKRSAPFHEYFLRRKTRPADKSISGILLSGFAARAVSDRHWEEEWLVLLERGVLLCSHSEKRKTRLRIHISHVLKVSAVGPDQAPFMQTYAFLCIETLGRSIYFIFENSVIRDEWLQTLSQLHASFRDLDKCSDSSEMSQRMLDIEQPSEEFLHKSSIWNHKSRRILNCGLYNLKCKTVLEDPIDMVKEALQLSIEAYSIESGEKRHIFFRSAGALKRAMVQTLSEDGRMAFFLNLYHTMIMHAFLVLGPPGSGLKWISFFNNLAYEGTCI